MKAFIENPALLINEFNEMAAIAQRKGFITIGLEIQKEEIETIRNYRMELTVLKKQFVEQKLENEANLVYCIENSLLAVQYELQMLVNIKEDRMSEAWGNLVNAQVTYGTVLRNRPSEFQVESENGYMARLEGYEKLLFPKMFFNSVGGIIKQSHCSICNESKCDHIKGRLYNGELCVRVVSEMELEEVSLVDESANKHCRMITISRDGKTIDLLTLREQVEPQ